MVIRSVLAVLVSVVVTLVLLFTMNALIKMAQPELAKKEGLKIPDFVYVPPPENLETITPKPEKPDEVLEQPDVPDVDITPTKANVDSSFGQGVIRFGINKDVNKGFNQADGEYLPIFKAPPVYPRRAQERGLCGWVIVEFTVTTSGGVRDPIVLESSSKLFESSAKKAALKFKYKPRQVGGKAAEVPGVQNKISYEIAGGC